MKDILSCPDAALHSTSDVARFLGRTSASIRWMVKKKTLTPAAKTTTSMYFTTFEIKRWLETAALFKDNKGVPPAHLKGHTDEPA